MDAKLVVVGGKAQATEFPLQLPAIVGRSRSADVLLGHPLVSRQHCELYEADGQLMVRDLGSLNGTFVGDTRVQDTAILSPGSLLTIGSVTFKAVYEGPVDGSSVSAAPVSTGENSAERTLEANGLGALEQARAQAKSPDASKSDTDELDLDFPEVMADEETREDVADLTEEAPPRSQKEKAPGPPDANKSEAPGKPNQDKPKSDEDLDDFFRSLMEP